MFRVRVRKRSIVVLVAATALVAVGCSSSDSGEAKDQIVLADGQELGDFNPLTYYGSLGVSPIYQGLLAPSADDDSRVPDLVPALAESAHSGPRPVSGGWRCAAGDVLRRLHVRRGRCGRDLRRGA